MKKLNIIFFLFLGSVFSLNAQNVNIPDANFKAALLANASINTNMDSEIQITEAQSFTGTINVNNLNIINLTGIEAFTALTRLICGSNQLTNINVSSNPNLIQLDCRLNQLTSLDVSNNTNLTILNCRNNQITTLDVSNQTVLTYLGCANNQLTTLTLGNINSLNYLECYNNQLTTLDVSQLSMAFSILCYNNQLTTLTLSSSPSSYLNELFCQNNLLTSLDLAPGFSGGNQGLDSVNCSNNLLTNLNINNNQLKKLYCSNNLLTNLNVEYTPQLTLLYCDSNQLNMLNVKNGNNLNITNTDFKAQGNLNLTCIQVDSVDYSVNNWTNIDPVATFSTVCFSSITDLGKTVFLEVYPNPTNGLVSMNLDKTYADIIVSVTNITGHTVMTKNYNATQQIELELEGSAGVYLVSIRTEDGEAVVKVVKE